MFLVRWIVNEADSAGRVVRRELYDSYLTRVLPPQPGVCETCRQPTVNRGNCDSCEQSLHALRLPAALVVPMVLRPPSSQVRNMTYQYKNDENADNRDNAEYALSRFAGRFLTRHEECVAEAAGVRRFDIVTAVPGSLAHRRDYDPVARMLERSPWTRELDNATRLCLALVDTGNMGASREAHPDRFRVVADVADSSVLLVDDTWTRGGHVLSAMKALLAAGAAKVATTVLARHFDPGFSPLARDYFTEAQRVRYDPRFCALCDPRGPAEPPLI